MAVELGLKFGLDEWRKGVRDASNIVKKNLDKRTLTPFEKGVKKVAVGMRTAFTAAATAIKGALMSAFLPLTAVLAPIAAIAGIRKALTESLTAFREASDAATTLRSALEFEGLGEDQISAVQASVGELGSRLRLAMGILQKDTDQAFATFVTRGFDITQAEQLTVLAANFAKKSGKPIADVTKMIADAANGSVDAMKELGVQITATGDAVRDGEAAVLAMKGAYGDIGSDLANPSERLAAAWNQLAVIFGEKISPALEPIIQGFADLVTGLSETEEGRKTMEALGDTVGWLARKFVEMFEKADQSISLVVSAFETGKALISGILNALMAEIVGIIESLLSGLPGGQKLADSWGLSELRKELQEATDKDAAAFQESLANFTGFGDGGLLSQIQQEGAEARKAAIEDLKRFQEETAGETFAGQAAQDRQAMIAANQAAAGGSASAANPREQAQQALANRSFGGSTGGVGSGGGGQEVRVRIVNTRPDRFRKARAR